jgi:RNase P/RNase MRP subunit p29
MQNIPLSKDEFIGKQVSITDASDPSVQQISGIIIDETKHMFHIKTLGGMKRIAKQIATFQFNHRGTPHRISGSTLCYRPEDRIKKTR